MDERRIDTRAVGKRITVLAAAAFTAIPALAAQSLVDTDAWSHIDWRAYADWHSYSDGQLLLLGGSIVLLIAALVLKAIRVHKGEHPPEAGEPATRDRYTRRIGTMPLEPTVSGERTG
jgi:hypothetical protein